MHAVLDMRPQVMLRQDFKGPALFRHPQELARRRIPDERRGRREAQDLEVMGERMPDDDPALHEAHGEGSSLGVGDARVEVCLRQAGDMYAEVHNELVDLDKGVQQHLAGVADDADPRQRIPITADTRCVATDADKFAIKGNNASLPPIYPAIVRAGHDWRNWSRDLVLLVGQQHNGARTRRFGVALSPCVRRRRLGGRRRRRRCRAQRAARMVVPGHSLGLHARESPRVARLRRDVR
mmetsp:Transcript_23274/g.67356  ORF Transcript_23274/g.67356 Transcript_23274/m.67356 type:complete len:238 (-) Transcript_23274:185-898(-)